MKMMRSSRNQVKIKLGIKDGNSVKPKGKKRRCIYIFFVVVISAEARQEKASKNDIVNLLKRYKVPTEDIPHYVCIAEHASGFDKVKIRPFKEGYESYGLFQVNSTDACARGKYPGGICNTTCASLHKPYMNPQIECAVKIVNTFCFWKWGIWTQFCRHFM
ncbi:lysozyme [Halyomorpha halys]|uniref:lysozyme n=1 Tax=Halyomorpha halys TaxID=286706 RepID=UPI0006D4D696|nr:lysozyme-like [Halyomorpha halys]